MLASKPSSGGSSARNFSNSLRVLVDAQMPIYHHSGSSGGYWMDGCGSVDRPSVSADGGLVAFSASPALVDHTSDALAQQTFVWHAATGAFESVSGDEIFSMLLTPAFAEISDNGRLVAFQTFRSGQTTEVADPSTGHGNIFVRDRQTGALERIYEDGWYADRISISPSGRHLAYSLSNLNQGWKTLIKDRQTGVALKVADGSGPPAVTDQVAAFFPGDSGPSLSATLLRARSSAAAPHADLLCRSFRGSRRKVPTSSMTVSPETAAARTFTGKTIGPENWST